MPLSQILFLIFGAITLGAALVVVTRRNLFHASLALIVSCMGVAGLLALLEAPIIAVLQLIVYAGGIAVLIKTNPLPTGITRSNAPSVNRLWWAAALIAAALCGTLGWVAFNHGQGLLPTGDVVALTAASPDLARFALPLIIAATLLSVAIVGAVKIVRKR